MRKASKKASRKAYFLKAEADLQKTKDQIDQKTNRRTERKSISAAILYLEFCIWNFVFGMEAEETYVPYMQPFLAAAP